MTSNGHPLSNGKPVANGHALSGGKALSSWNGKQLFHYYDSLESRIGYRLFLGGTRHFGFYESPQAWPFPITPALRKMDDLLLGALDVPRGSRVLDCGCGVGLVALHVADKGDLFVDGFDFMERHIRKGRRFIEAAGMSDKVKVQQRDYHKLESIPDSSYDGLYSMETLVHSPTPRSVLESYFRILKPGGTMVLHEYDHIDPDLAPKDLSDNFKEVWRISEMQGWVLFLPGVLENMLRETGFEVVYVKDYSQNIWPMLWLFYIFALVPYYVVKLLGLQDSFINTMAGYSSWKGRRCWGYLQYKVRKPLADEAQAVGGTRES